MEFYVYRHIRLDTNTPFYVGKGKNHRAHSSDGRNPYWHRIKNKAGYKVEIIRYFNKEEKALDFEKTLINLYRQYDMCEANLTDGAGGISGFVHSESVKERIRQTSTERWKDPEYKKRVSKKISKSKKRYKFTKEHKKNIGLANKGKSLPKSTKDKISLANKGKVFSASHRKNISISAKKRGMPAHIQELGRKAANSKKISDETRKKLSAARSGKKHHQWKGYVHTPNGVYETTRLAAEAIGLSIMSVTRRCSNPNIKDWYYEK